MRLLLFLITILTYAIPCLAQNPLPDSFFPHKLGDKWQYDYADPQPHLAIEEITSDSLAADSSVFIEINKSKLSGWSYRIDKQGNVYYLPQAKTVNFLLYKSDADSGDIWEYKIFDNGYASVARLENVFEDVIFGIPTVIKKISYYANSSFKSWLESRYYASGFGLILLTAEATPYNYVQMLAGCSIDGKNYGTLVNVENKKKNGSPSFILEQNYPNPFNPTTTIDFAIDKYCYVKLEVFDMLGRKISTLINDYKQPGRYSTTFKAENISSGIYFYKLAANDRSLIMKMFYVK
jgi:hypothetical protein